MSKTHRPSVRVCAVSFVMSKHLSEGHVKHVIHECLRREGKQQARVT